MTVIVGVRCTDGIVVGSDSVASSAMGASPLISLPSNSKIQIFPGNVIVATTGSVGYTQRLHAQIELAIKGNVFKNLPVHECTANIAKRMLSDLQSSMAQRHAQQGLQFGALIAAPIRDEAYLVEYGTMDFQPEIKKDKLFFVSMGSGQLLADPFLAFVKRMLWKDEPPTVDVGKFGVYWVLDHTIRLAPGGVGGPIKLATLRQVGGAWTAEGLEDTQEQAEYVGELETHVGNFARHTIEQAPTTPPPAPPDPADIAIMQDLGSIAEG